MEGSTVVIRAIKPIVLISRCIGQLPVLWNARTDWWYVAPWYHPQFIYFVLLLIVRTVVYVSIAYAIVASQFSSQETISFSALVISEMAYTWLRLFLPVYLLLLNLRPLSEGVKKLQKIDALLGIETSDFANKPRKLTACLYTVTAISVLLVIFAQRDFYSWYIKHIPSEIFCRIIVACMGMDLMTEATLIIQFCLAALLLQQRLSSIAAQLNMTSEIKNLEHVWKDGVAFSKVRTPDSVLRLRYTYSLVYQVAEEILGSFGLPLLCITLGEILLLTLHVYGIANYARMQSSSESLSTITYSLIFLAIHSIFILSTLFCFADRIAKEVSNLTTLLQAKVCSVDIQDTTVKDELREFHRVVSMNPFPRTSAAGLYNIGKSLVPGILGVIFSYLVVLTQFDNKPQPCGGNNATVPSSGRSLPYN